MHIGFSTGALAQGDFAAALGMLDGHGTTAIELSALRMNELDPLLRAIPHLDLHTFPYKALHAPSRFDTAQEAELAGRLAEAVPDEWSIVVHPDAITDFGAWRVFGARLCIENMDKSKRTGRTAAELMPLFTSLPDASLCLDLAHARQFDPTMSRAAEIMALLGERLRQIHISDINSRGQHLPLSSSAVYAYRRIMPLIPQSIPFIIESVVPEHAIGHELRMIDRLMDLGTTACTVPCEVI